MSKLQNDFTTPEQSKRLLELGLHADSANCYLLNESQDPLAYVNYSTHIIQPFHDKRIMFSQLEDFIPCWSVGRLIEIYLICNEVIDNVTELHHSAIKVDVREFNIVEYMIRKLSNKVKKNKSFFSKLEE